MLDPIRPQFLPISESCGQALFDEYRLKVAHRNRGFAVNCGGARFVGQEGEEQAKLPGGSNEIVLAHQFGELFFKVLVSRIGLFIQAVQPAQQSGSYGHHEPREIAAERSDHVRAEHFRLRVSHQILGNEPSRVGPLDHAARRPFGEPCKVWQTEPARAWDRRIAHENAAMTWMRALRSWQLQ